MSYGSTIPLDEEIISSSSSSSSSILPGGMHAYQSVPSSSSSNKQDRTSHSTIVSDASNSAHESHSSSPTSSIFLKIILVGAALAASLLLSTSVLGTPSLRTNNVVGGRSDESGSILNLKGGKPSSAVTRKVPTSSPTKHGKHTKTDDNSGKDDDDDDDDNDNNNNHRGRTSEPTRTPTHVPPPHDDDGNHGPATSEPTIEPTKHEAPPIEPAHPDTQTPTYEPSFEPTEPQPTELPTWEPSEHPTEIPTYEPTYVVQDEFYDPSLKFTLHRAGYDPLAFFTESPSQIINYKIFENRVAVIEPSAEVNLYILGGDLTSSGYTYQFEVCPYDATSGSVDTDACTAGALAETSKHVTIDCNPYDEYVITVKEYDDSKNELRSNTGLAICLYVRREVRSLTTTDLTKVMDAMYKLWSVSEEDGQALYGEKFHAAKYFSEIHNFNAAQQDADHIHEGMGFLPQHVKITNFFEESIQAVDPSVSLFYWDFTIDTESGIMLDESPIFTEDTFGTINFPADDFWGWTYSNDSMLDAAIPNGRWKNAAADLNDRYPDLGNAFGYMRGPWNTNPSPYISRFSVSRTRLPSCSDYSDWLQTEDLATFLNIAPYGPHASTHGAIGAVYGCDMMNELTEGGYIKDEDTQRKICKKWGFSLKELYRQNLIFKKNSSECSVTSLDLEGISCGITCSEEDYDLIPAAIKTQITAADVPDDMDESGWEVWRDFVCSGNGHRIFVGDHLESASPSDPSFWVIHTTQERLLQAKFMGGGFGSQTWSTDKSTVCDKYECYEAEYGASGSYDECCYGHNEFDQLLDFVNGVKSQGYGPTNADVMRGTDPTREDYSMPYIYDDFTWSHCDDDFPTMISELASRRR